MDLFISVPPVNNKPKVVGNENDQYKCCFGKKKRMFFLSLEHGQRHFQLARLEHGQHTRVLIAPLSEKSSR